MTYDGSYLWSAIGSIYGENYFRRIDPNTHEVVEIFTYNNQRRGKVTGLAWVNSTLWAILDISNDFIQFDPNTGEVLDSFACIAKEPRGLAWDGEALWTSDYDSQQLYRINPVTREVLGTFNPAPISENNWDESLYIWGLAFGEGPPDPE